MDFEKVSGKISKVRLETPLYATLMGNLHFFVLSVFKDMFDRDFDGMWLEAKVEFDSQISLATLCGYDLYFVGSADDEEQAIRKVSSLTERLWKGSGKCYGDC